MPKNISLGSSDALLVIDVQNDFLPGGALAVPGGAEVVPVLNAWIERFHEQGLPVIATRDWHPPDHCSFRPQGGPWPVHCVANSEGARFAAGLVLPEDALIISKAAAPEQDSYSGFEGTDLAERLRRLGVQRLFTGGLATDYCVLATVRQALALGFGVCLLTEAVRAVNVQPGDGERAIREMIGLGAVSVSLRQMSS